MYKLLFLCYLKLDCTVVCKAAGDKCRLNTQNSIIYSYSSNRCGGFKPASNWKTQQHCPEAQHLRKHTCAPSPVKKRWRQIEQKVMWLSWVKVFSERMSVCVCIFCGQMVRNKTEKGRVQCVCRQVTREILLIREFNTTREEIRNILIVKVSFVSLFIFSYYTLSVCYVLLKF